MPDPSGTGYDGTMPVISNSIDIDRPADAVFCYVSDMRTEAGWNPVARSVTLVSPEPVGRGSAFRCVWKGLGTSTMEVVDFAPPATWTTHATEGALPVRLTGTVAETTARTCRLTMRIELLPVGVMRPLGPVVAVMMGPSARANLRRIKAAVEASPAPHAR